MSSRRLQEVLDELQATSNQRWALRAVVVTAALAATVATSLAASEPTRFLSGVIVVFAAVSAASPNSSAGLVTLGVISFQWLLTVDDVASPWSLVVALAMAVLHAALAFMAVTPRGATAAGRVLWSRLRDVLVVGAAAGGVWALTMAVKDRDAPGSVVLTLGAFVALAGGAIAVRSRGLRLWSASSR